MYLVQWKYLCLLVFWLLDGMDTGQAELFAIFDNHNTVRTMPTSDYFLHQQPYYNQTGLAVRWYFNNDTKNCTLLDIKRANSSVSALKAINGTINATATATIAFVININEAYDVECKTIAQIGDAVQIQSKELHQQLGYPLASLLILLDRETRTIPLWGPDTIGYRTSNPSIIPDGPPSIKVTLVDRAHSEILEEELSKTPAFQYVAIQEKGPWNERFLSPKYMVHHWIFIFVIILIVSISSTNTCIHVPLVLMLHLPLPYISFSGHVLALINDTLSKIPFDLILLYWSFLGKRLFAFPTLVSFRLFVIIDLLVSIVAFVLRMLALYGITLTKVQNSTHLSKMARGTNYVGIINFGGFTLWFAWKTYQLRKNLVIKARFIQVCSLLTLQA
ncbi:hypothetical protein BDF22DRAFT_679309 [Syncephalis plumigaleata]|nr:hypothetical protein BDF22DRAFT_679309 [Syncephalis plumigaleata]